MDKTQTREADGATKGKNRLIYQKISSQPSPAEVPARRHKRTFKKKVLLTFLVIGAAIASVWFLALPSKEQLEENVQALFLSLCADNNIEIDAEDIEGMWLHAERWMDKYEGVVMLKRRIAGQPLHIPITVRLEHKLLGFEGWHFMLTINPPGMLQLRLSTLGTPFNGDAINNNDWDF